MKYAFVLLALGCLLTVVNAQWLETTIQLDSGSAPHALCYNSQNNKVYCANSGLGTVTVIGGDSNQVIATVPADPGPYDLCYNPTNNKVYCANYGSYLDEDSTVTIVDGATDSVIATLVVGHRPRALCCNPQDNKVYCANGSSNNVIVIDGASNSVVATVAAGVGPRALCYNPTDHKVYCANNSDSSVTVIDGAGDSVVATVLVRRGPCALCYNPTANKVYCAVWGPNQVTVIDGGTNSVIATVQLMRDEPMACCYDPQNNKVYIAGRGDWGVNAGVSVIDGASNDTIRSIATDFGSRDLCLNPVQNRVYVANYESSTISVIRDSMTGIEESPKPQAIGYKQWPTILSGTSIGKHLASCVIFDAMGRRVVSAESGVYFIAVSGERSAVSVRKVVIQR